MSEELTDCKLVWELCADNRKHDDLAHRAAIRVNELLATRDRLSALNAELVKLVEVCANLNECDLCPDTARLIRTKLAALSPNPSP